MALEQRAKLDTEVVTRLRREQGELLKTSERLRTECGTVHGVRD